MQASPEDEESDEDLTGRVCSLPKTERRRPRPNPPISGILRGVARQSTGRICAAMGGGVCERRLAAEPVNFLETDGSSFHWVGVSSSGLLIHAVCGSGGGVGGLRTNLSG